MGELPFKQVDVFSRLPFKGNPVAVVFDADALSDESMQAAARWTNLSETVFFQHSTTADYRLRIFTPLSELVFAGHPTIGAAHAALESGLVQRPRFTMQCLAGLVSIEADEDNLIMARLPRAEVLSELEPAEIAGMFGPGKLTQLRLICSGPNWLVARADSIEELLAFKLNNEAVTALAARYKAVGLTLYAAENGQVEVRSFAPGEGIAEDPVCGSGNGAVAVHLAQCDDGPQYSQYTARQGRCVGRDGFISVRRNETAVSIGGYCHTTIDGRIKPC